MMPNFAQAFKITMDATGVKAARLAEASGRSRNNISDIRNGRVRPNIEDFGQLLEVGEQLHPGFIRRFSAELAGAVDFFSPESIRRMDQKQLSAIMLLIADVLDAKLSTDTVQGHRQGTMEEVLAAS